MRKQEHFVSQDSHNATTRLMLTNKYYTNNINLLFNVSI